MDWYEQFSEYKNADDLYHWLGFFFLVSLFSESFDWDSGFYWSLRWETVSTLMSYARETRQNVEYVKIAAVICTILAYRMNGYQYMFPKWQAN